MKNYREGSTIFIIVSIFFVVFFQSVVYSAFSSIFDVTGTAYARLATDVRITDFKISEKYTSSNYVSNYENFSRNNISTSITFNDTGTVYYDVEATNYNENKVGIYTIGNLPDGISYSFLDYNLGDVLLDGIGATTFTICFTGSGSFEFDFDIDFRTSYNITYIDFEGSGYPNIIFENEEKVIDFGDEDVSGVSMVVGGVEYIDFVLGDNILTFGPVDGDVIITKQEKIIKVVSGDYDTVGSEICIDTECFYVISSDETSVTMLSKYNLYVGNECTSIYSCSSYGDEATGIQDSEMIAKPSDNSYPRKGTTIFSSTNYWSSTVSSYPTYVYDNNSFIYDYIENYKVYLEGQDVEVEEVRLIKTEELEVLGCSMDDLRCVKSPSWVYGTSYWTGSAYDSTAVMAVNSKGSIEKTGFNYDTENRSFGVRPVIRILKSVF